MARVLITAQSLPGPYPTLPVPANARDLSEQAGDPILGNYTPLVDGRTVVIAHNVGLAAQTVTIISQADPYRRTGDITDYSIDPGELALFGAFEALGWSDAGRLDIDVSDADIALIVLTLS